MNFTNESSRARLLAAALVLSPIMAQAQEAAGNTQAAVTAPASAQPAVDPTVVKVGDMSFKVASLRVSAPGSDPTSSASSEAVITVEATNLSKERFALGYRINSANLVDDHGYQYDPDNGQYHQVSGAGPVNDNEADTSFPIEPGETLRVRIIVKRRFARGQSMGSTYDFSAVFCALQDQGEGKVRTVRKYPVSVIGIHRASAAEQLGSQGKDVADSVKGALGRIFGK